MRGGRREILSGVGVDGQGRAALAGAGGGGEQAVGADLADEAGADLGDEEIAGAIEGDAGGIDQPGVAGGSAIGAGLGVAPAESGQGGLRGDFADHIGGGDGVWQGFGECDVAVRVGGNGAGRIAVWSGGPSGEGEEAGPPAMVLTMPLVSMRRIRSPVRELGPGVWTK